MTSMLEFGIGNSAESGLFNHGGEAEKVAASSSPWLSVARPKRVFGR